MPEYIVDVIMDSEFAKTFHSALIKCIKFDDFNFLDVDEADALSEFCATLGDKIVIGDSDA